MEEMTHHLDMDQLNSLIRQLKKKVLKFGEMDQKKENLFG